MQVKLVSVTQSLVKTEDQSRFLTAEELLIYIARVSNPANQLNIDTAPKLIKHCLTNKHWSVFEQSDICFEIKTSRGIAAQILRHGKGFSFQEFSQRYSAATELEPIELRRQAKTNRQSSLEVFDPEIPGSPDYEFGLCLYHPNSKASEIINHLQRSCLRVYEALLKAGVAKEVARFVLPLNTQTTLYMKGPVRSWLTYFNQRLHEHAQKEHRLIAVEESKIFMELFPVVSSVYNNFETAQTEYFLD